MSAMPQKPHVLQKARIEEADTLIVTLDNDSLNIFTVLAGLHLNPVLMLWPERSRPGCSSSAAGRANHVLAESL